MIKTLLVAGIFVIALYFAGLINFSDKVLTFWNWLKQKAEEIANPKPTESGNGGDSQDDADN
jgi:hypothetical protein